MTFISYAQNFEDVMLWRALQHVKNGFYIDVGANDPTFESVTRAFYDRGWHGINIEPGTSHYADLQQNRYADINLCCATGANDGEIAIWECDVCGWTTSSDTLAQEHKHNGHHGNFHQTPVYALHNICEKYAHDEIHFLKVDVHGMEQQVFEGMDFLRFRPWIMLVKLAPPDALADAYDTWDRIITSYYYFLVYTDGLNRFYLADEHAGLTRHFRYPPNVLDNFISADRANFDLKIQEYEARITKKKAQIALAAARAAQAEARVTLAEGRAINAENRAVKAEAQTFKVEQNLQQIESNLRALYSSNSWRITAPLRWVSKAIQWAVHGSMAGLPLKPGSRPLRTLQLLLMHMKLYVGLRPRLRSVLRFALIPFPGLKRRLKRVGASSSSLFGTASPFTGPAQFSPRTSKIYAALTSARKRYYDEEQN